MPTFFNSHGSRGPTRGLVGNLDTISNIEAIPTTRLSELWHEQSFWDGRASLRAGQLVVDTEFLFSHIFLSLTRAIGQPIRRSISRAAARLIRSRGRACD